MHALRHLRAAAVLTAVCLAGGGTAVAVASSDDRNKPEDSTTGTTTDRTTTTPRSATGTPRIGEIEADWAGNGRLRLRTEIVTGAAGVTSVRFTYRGRTVRGRRSGNEWSRVVTARGGDRRGSVVTVRVRACAGSRCVSRTGRDEAGG
jgi:hypothetical protein